MSTSPPDDTDTDDSSRREPQGRFEWLLVGVSLVTMAVVFFIAPELGWDLHPAAEWIGYAAIATLFGPATVREARARLGSTDDDTNSDTDDAADALNDDTEQRRRA